MIRFLNICSDTSVSSREVTMTTEAIPTRRELVVAVEYQYHRTGPVRGMLSHVLG